MVAGIVPVMYRPRFRHVQDPYQKLPRAQGGVFVHLPVLETCGILDTYKLGNGGLLQSHCARLRLRPPRLALPALMFETADDLKPHVEKRSFEIMHHRLYNTLSIDVLHRPLDKADV